MTAGKGKKTDELAPALRALADPTRLKILLMLEGKERTVGEIVQFFALAQPTITRHLQTLAAAGLVQRRKEGQRVYYGTNLSNLGNVCVDLASSFPCCCVAVSVSSPPARRKSTKRGAAKKSGTSSSGTRKRPAR